jgi:hypothetical protein
MLLSTLLSFAAPLLAPQQESRQWMELVPGAGAFERHSTQPGQGLSARSHHSALVSSPRWQVLDLGALWIGGPVDIGDNGASVFASHYLNSEGFALHATGSASPIFEHSTVGSETPQVAVADRAPVAASMVVRDLGGQNYQAEVEVYSTIESGTPTFQYSFPASGAQTAGGVAVSDDGDVVLTWKSNANTGLLQIEAFDGSGNSISSGAIQSNGSYASRQTRLSDDGSRAYFFIGTNVHIYEVATASVIHTHNVGASFDSHAFSGDGRSFANGTFGSLSVYQEQGGSWVLRHRETFASATYISQLDLDQDGDRCAYQLQRYSPAYDHIETGMIDVDAGQVLWSDSFDAPGTTAQLVCSGVRTDDAGQIVVSSSWGDSLNLTPEVAAWDVNGQRQAEIDLAGSAFSLDLSPDGEVWAAGSKGVHANVFGNGGAITAGDPIEQILHVLGVPRAGGQVQLQIADGWNRVRVGISTQLGASSTPYGFTDIDLNFLYAEMRAPVPSGGLDLTLQVPPRPSLWGAPMHVQAVVRGASGSLITNKVSTRIVL